MLIFWFLFTSFSLISPFEVLPYVQIDYYYYLRLAQCQAKCAEKYGISTHQKMSNGELRTFLNSTEQNEVCELGCLYQNVPVQEERNSMHAFSDGQQFWIESHSYTRHLNSRKKLTKNEQKSNPGNPQILRPISRTRVLCIQDGQKGSKLANRAITSSSPHLAQDFLQTLEALLAIDLANNQNANDGRTQENLRFVVQWKRRAIIDAKNEEIYGSSNVIEEKNWITASIEPKNVFKVVGLQFGFSYRFAITAVSSNGKLSRSHHSNWINFGALANLQEFTVRNKARLEFYSRYNSENNVGVLIRWRTGERSENDGTLANISDEVPRVKRLQRDLRHFAPLDQRLQIQTSKMEETTSETFLMDLKSNEVRSISSTSLNQRNDDESLIVFPSCQIQVEISNRTMKIVEDLTIDESDGVFISNLAFNSHYIVEFKKRQSLHPSSSTITTRNTKQSNLTNQKEVEKADVLLAGTFLSMHCWQVYGVGSLECDPEPVKILDIKSNPENGTVTVNWSMVESSSAQNILLYEITYRPIEDLEECTTDSNSKVIGARVNSATLKVEVKTHCEFELTVTNYDLLGRDASVTRRFTFTPPGFEKSEVSINGDTSNRVDKLLLQADPAMLALVGVVVFIPASAVLALFCTLKHTKKHTKSSAKENKNDIKKATQMIKLHNENGSDNTQTSCSSSSSNSPAATTIVDTLSSAINKQICTRGGDFAETTGPSMSKFATFVDRDFQVNTVKNYDNLFLENV